MNSVHDKMFTYELDRCTRLGPPTRTADCGRATRYWRYPAYCCSIPRYNCDVQVMKEDLRSVSHSFALHALRQTPNRVRLVIHREDDEIYEQLDVELVKKRDRGLGLR